MHSNRDKDGTGERFTTNEGKVSRGNVVESTNVPYTEKDIFLEDPPNPFRDRTVAYGDGSDPGTTPAGPLEVRSVRVVGERKRDLDESTPQKDQ